jgi:hypothetical protein
VTLAFCHLVLVPIIIVAVRILGRPAEVPGRSDVITEPA